MRIFLFANIHRPDALMAASETAAWLRDRNIEVQFDRESAIRTKEPLPPTPDLGADLVVAFGGDGTLIRAAHFSAESGTPILGVYYGRFGFVTQCQGDEVYRVLNDFIDNRFRIENRMMLEGELRRGGQVVTKLTALNEIVLQRDVATRMMTFRVAVDGHKLTSYPADGVMICSPTGSTAYNLSAGGPIMDPTVEALILTALAPHTLNARTLVLRPDSQVLLTVQSHGDAVLSADGQTRLHILSDDEVRVTRSHLVTKLLLVRPNDFLLKLGQRLLWSKGLVEDSE